MYKIEIRTHAGRLIKSKTYQSAKLYEKWFKKHTADCVRVYQITGFRWVNEGWENIK